MTNNAAGLSFQEAFDQAQAEVSLEEEISPAPSSAEPEPTKAPEVEQSAVETGEEEGLFTNLSPDQEGKQPPKEDLHEVKVQGETFKVTLQELINGYQRQEDYTRGKQELTAEKEKLSKAQTLWDALESDYVGTVQALMSRSGIKGKVTPKGAAPATEDIEALVNQKLEERLASDPRLQAFEQEQSLREIEAIFDNVQKEFDITLTRGDKQAVLERADQLQNYDLRYVTWTMLQEAEKTAAEQKNVELVSTAQGRRSGADAEPVTPNIEYFNSPKAAWEAALAEIGEPI